MGMSPFLRAIRAKVGHDLLVLPAVAGLALDSEGRVLVIRHASHGLWCFPAGFVEPDEPPEAAVVREMREETGLDVEPIGVLGVGGGPDYRVEYPNGDVVSYVATLFECRVAGGELRPDGREALDARFFVPNELPDLNLSRIDRALLTIARNHPRFANRFAKPSY